MSIKLFGVVVKLVQSKFITTVVEYHIVPTYRVSIVDSVTPK